MTALLIVYAPLLLLTLAIELAVVALAAPHSQRRAALAACAALNLLTHPIATLLAWRCDADILVLELVVLLCEWIGYSHLLRVGWGTSLRLAFLANICSALAGVGIWIARTT